MLKMVIKEIMKVENILDGQTDMMNGFLRLVLVFKRISNL